jgi:hypothetical protein
MQLARWLERMMARMAGHRHSRHTAAGQPACRAAKLVGVPIRIASPEPAGLFCVGQKLPEQWRVFDTLALYVLVVLYNMFMTITDLILYM